MRRIILCCFVFLVFGCSSGTPNQPEARDSGADGSDARIADGDVHQDADESDTLDGALESCVPASLVAEISENHLREDLLYA